MGTEVESPNSNQRVSQLISDSFLFLEGEQEEASGANGNTSRAQGALEVKGHDRKCVVSANGNTEALIANGNADSGEGNPSSGDAGDVCDVEKPIGYFMKNTGHDADKEVLVPTSPALGAVGGSPEDSRQYGDSTSTGVTKRDMETHVSSGKNSDKVENSERLDTQIELSNIDLSKTGTGDSTESRGISIKQNSVACDSTTSVDCKYKELSEPKKELKELTSHNTLGSSAIDLRKCDPNMGSGQHEEEYEARLRQQARVIVDKVLNYNSLREALKKSHTWCKNRRLWQWRDSESGQVNGHPVRAANGKLRLSDPQTYRTGGETQPVVRAGRHSTTLSSDSLEGVGNLTLSDISSNGQENSTDFDNKPKESLKPKSPSAGVNAKTKRSKFYANQLNEISPPELADDESPEATCTVAASAAVKLRRKRSEVGSRPCERKVSCDSAGGKPSDKRVSCDSASSSPGQSPVAVRRHVLRSPVLRIKQEWNTVDITTSDSDSPRQSEDSDDDDDGGIYAESYRQSQWLYLGGSLGACSTDNLDAEADTLDADRVRTSTSSSVFDAPQDTSLGEGDVMADDVEDVSVTSQKETLNASVDSGLGQSESTSPRLYKQRVLHDDLPPTLPRRPRHHRSESISTTASEIEFRKRYQAKTKRIVQRKSSTQTYQRMSERFYDEERAVVIEKGEGDPTFGFHIKGHRPVMVSTVETGSAAERAGVKVGDAVIAVNDVNVMEVTHQEAIRLISFDSSRVKLTLATDHRVLSDVPLCSGFLIKQGGSGILKNWRRRWFVLKQDHCLYYYKTEEDKDPLGAIMLTNYTITKAPESNRKNSFKAHKYGQRTYYLQAESEDDMNEWASALSNAAKATTKTDTWLDVSSHNVGLPALSIKGPDCHGHLTKMGNRRKNWKRRYCVLKDACLYYYIDLTSSTAQGVAHLHGYTVEESLPFNRKFGFTLVPPDPSMRTFYFSADNETDMKRWIKALRKSIGRWVREEDF